jgi:hypothetical protein
MSIFVLKAHVDLLNLCKRGNYLKAFYSHVIKFLSASLNRAIIENKEEKSLKTFVQ